MVNEPAEDFTDLKKEAYERFLSEGIYWRSKRKKSDTYKEFFQEVKSLSSEIDRNIEEKRTCLLNHMNIISPLYETPLTSEELQKMKPVPLGSLFNDILRKLKDKANH